MMPIAKLIASCLGIGYIKKGAGTAAALFYCLLWWVGKIGESSIMLQLAIIILLFFGGVWSATLLEKKWGHDSARVVIDEVVGMAITLLLVPTSWPPVLVGFLLFRVLDIVKPLGIKTMEKLNAGWGVMMDDVLAALYAFILLRVLLILKPDFIV